MPEGLSKEERNFITRVSQSGYDRSEAAAVIVLTTRQYSRPIEDLISTLQHYPGLESAAASRRAVEGLLARGDLIEDSVDGATLVGPAPNIRQRLATLLGDPTIEEELGRLRRVNDDYATVIGPLRDRETYTTYLDVLRGAQTHVLMPHIMTDPNGLGAVDILCERARLGVSVKVLAASVSLAKAFRGATAGIEAERRAGSWKRIADATPNLEFRVTENKSDLLFATSILVDRTLLRMVLHDPFHERSKEGVVVEFGSIDARRLNVIRDFETRFNRAWRRGRSPTRLGLVWWCLRSFWQLVVAAALFFASVAIASTDSGSLGAMLGPALQPALFNVLISASVSFAFTGALDFYHRFAETKEISSDP